MRVEIELAVLPPRVSAEYEIERVVRWAYEAAARRSKVVTSVDQANVLETSRLWREVNHRLNE